MKISIGFTPFQIVYRVEPILSIECNIRSLKLVVKLLPNIFAEKEHILYLPHLNENHCEVTMANVTHKKCAKAQYEKHDHPHVFVKGDLVLVYDQDHDKLGVGKFQPLWHGPYIISHLLQEKSYVLVDYEGNDLS